MLAITENVSKRDCVESKEFCTQHWDIAVSPKKGTLDSLYTVESTGACNPDAVNCNELSRHNHNRAHVGRLPWVRKSSSLSDQLSCLPFSMCVFVCVSIALPFPMYACVSIELPFHFATPVLRAAAPPLLTP